LSGIFNFKAFVRRIAVGHEQSGTANRRGFGWQHVRFGLIARGTKQRVSFHLRSNRVGRDGMSNNDGAPLSISALTSLCEQSKLFYATAVTSSPLTRGVACEAASGYLH